MATSAQVKTILLVDDNQLFLKMLSQAFKKSGIECITAESGKQALDKLNLMLPDAILSDYEMPGMNGMEFRQQLMTNDTFKDIPFIFLTYITDNDLMVKGLNLQAVDYVIKDTPVNVIVSKINNLIYTVQKQQELSKSELKKAAEALNVKSIPTKTPEIDDFDIDFWHRPYQDIPGGDFIDFIHANERYTFIVLGDIMGKKWMAWFFTFSFLSYIRAAIRFCVLSRDYSVGSILQKVNDVICLDDVLKDILSSLSLLMIDNETQIITYAGAGDLPLLHFEADTSTLKQISGDGLLLGLFAGNEYTEQQITLAKNDQLLIFTDGMIDFSDDTGKKSDYNTFARNIDLMLNKKYSFKRIQDELFEPSLAVQVDDCSIINIRKTM
jgi:sigma-B regulation protein RsbU (phosphoserine phosphatase)